MSSASPDRRRFLGLAAVAGAALAAPALRAETDPYRRWRGSLIVNALGGIGNPNADDGDENPSGLEESKRKRLTVDARELADLRASGLTALNCTLGYVAGSRRSVPAHDLRDRAVRAAVAGLPERVPEGASRGGHRAGQARWQGRTDLRLPEHRDDRRRRSNASMCSPISACASIQLTYNPANAVGDGAMAPRTTGASRRSAARSSRDSTKAV